MSDTVVRIEGLGKRYSIGARQKRHDTLRDTIMSLFERRAAAGESGDETIWALKDVSFEVKQGEVVGIIGRNGAGKTTLLKILSRITEPTEGWAEIRGRVGSLLEVGTGFHPELTGRENVYLNGAILGMRRAEIARRFDEIVAFAEIDKFLDTPVKRYSSGMYVRLAFAVAAHLVSDILVVDEVLSVGDAAFQEKCLGKMDEAARGGRTVLFVSHNLAAVEHLCKRGIVLHQGELDWEGTATEAVVRYEESLRIRRSGAEALPSHVLFAEQIEDAKAKFRITRVELLDKRDNPKPRVHTWEGVKIRVHYFAEKRVRAGSLVIQINTRHGITVLLLSTEPDSGVPMSIEPGHHYGDCEILRLPLSSGEYTIGCGLAIPNKEWLCSEPNLGILKVYPRDVYKSGQAPTGSRSILAIPHRWKV